MVLCSKIPLYKATLFRWTPINAAAHGDQYKIMHWLAEVSVVVLVCCCSNKIIDLRRALICTKRPFTGVEYCMQSFFYIIFSNINRFEPIHTASENGRVNAFLTLITWCGCIIDFFFFILTAIVFLYTQGREWERGDAKRVSAAWRMKLSRLC